MPNFAIIENGKVINTIIAENEYANQQGWIALPDGAGIDWDYMDRQFIEKRREPEIIVASQPTKQELLTQLQTIQTQIEALE